MEFDTNEVDPPFPTNLLEAGFIKQCCHKHKKPLEVRLWRNEDILDGVTCLANALFSCTFIVYRHKTHQNTQVAGETYKQHYLSQEFDCGQDH